MILATGHFLDPDKILKITVEVGFKVTEAEIRYPYIRFEHKNTRAGIMLKIEDNI